MRVIGVTSLRRRGYVAAHRGYIALSRGYVADHLCNSLSALVFSTTFRLLPFSYLLSTSRLCGQVRRIEEKVLCAKGYDVRLCAVVGQLTGTFRKRRRFAPSARRATGSSALRAAESYRTGPYRLGGCAASHHGAVKSRWPASVGKVLHEEDVSTAGDCGSNASWSNLSLRWRISLFGAKARQGRVRPEGRIRGEPVGGCGTPANEPALSTPSRGGQRSRPRAGAGITIEVAQRGFVGSERPPGTQLRMPRFGRILLNRTHANPDFQRAEIVSVSCPDGMSDKRGLVLFQPQQRHAKTWRVVAETARAPTPQGSRRVATRGWCSADL